MWSMGFLRARYEKKVRMKESPTYNRDLLKIVSGVSVIYGQLFI
jgi:hypothetical protein